MRGQRRFNLRSSGFCLNTRPWANSTDRWLLFFTQKYCSLHPFPSTDGLIDTSSSYQPIILFVGLIDSHICSAPFFFFGLVCLSFSYFVFTGVVHGWVPGQGVLYLAQRREWVALGIAGGYLYFALETWHIPFIHLLLWFGLVVSFASLLFVFSGSFWFD